MKTRNLLLVNQRKPSILSRLLFTFTFAVAICGPTGQVIISLDASLKSPPILKVDLRGQSG